jgi:hypothetical protein
MRMTDLLSRVAAVCLAAASLSGCASDPRFSSGLEWIEGQAAERQRLEAMGFPQFTGPN